MLDCSYSSCVDTFSVVHVVAFCGLIILVLFMLKFANIVMFSCLVYKFIYVCLMCVMLHVPPIMLVVFIVFGLL